MGPHPGGHLQRGLCGMLITAIIPLSPLKGHTGKGMASTANPFRTHPVHSMLRMAPKGLQKGPNYGPKRGSPSGFRPLNSLSSTEGYLTLRHHPGIAPIWTPVLAQKGVRYGPQMGPHLDHALSIALHPIPSHPGMYALDGHQIGA